MLSREALFIFLESEGCCRYDEVGHENLDDREIWTNCNEGKEDRYAIVLNRDVVPSDHVRTICTALGLIPPPMDEDVGLLPGKDEEPEG